MAENSHPHIPPHILAINNDPAVLGLFRDLLEDDGYQVTTQAYVDKDLQAIAAVAPDLIILDYMWADEDAGWAMLQMLRMNPATASIPLILCTGAVREVEALSAHLDDVGIRVVLKPFSIYRLLAEIAEVLRTSAGDSEPINSSASARLDGTAELPATARDHREIMHDLRTPLTAALGRVQLLRRRLSRGIDQIAFATDLEAIEAALVRLAAAVERVDHDGRGRPVPAPGGESSNWDQRLRPREHPGRGR